MNVSVVLSTYQSPALLERTLRGYARQTVPPLEIVIADDGSGPETAAAIARLAVELGLELRHVWHEDRGFRKCAILNRAIESARGEYLLFSDGDCIPWADFVETHAALARPGLFLSGGYFRLPRSTTERLTVEDVAAGRHEDLRWLHRNGLDRSLRARRLAARGALARLLDLVTPTRATWNGHNASGWKNDLVEINGFDERMGYGGEDRELGERLVILGRRGRQIRHRAIVVHQWHERGYVSDQVLRANRRIRRETVRAGVARTPFGIVADSGERVRLPRP
jgi:glycosyltransferase involved in cell wall biosynthesis